MHYTMQHAGEVNLDALTELTQMLIHQAQADQHDAE